MSMDKTLLPCPFCGGEVSIALCGDGFDAWWFITRGHGENACKCRLFMESEKFNKDSEMADFVADDLIAAWNRRANLGSCENELIVRCENCKHYNRIGCSDGFGWCERMDIGTNDDFYCSLAERSEG